MKKVALVLIIVMMTSLFCSCDILWDRVGYVETSVDSVPGYLVNPHWSKNGIDLFFGRGDRTLILEYEPIDCGFSYVDRYRSEEYRCERFILWAKYDEAGYESAKAYCESYRGGELLCTLEGYELYGWETEARPYFLKTVAYDDESRTIVLLGLYASGYIEQIWDGYDPCDMPFWECFYGDAFSFK